VKTIGIIANPASGKDIRRLVSHATVVDNHEKINIVERIILAAQSCGVEKVMMMPDTFQIGYKVEDNLKTTDELKIDLEILKIPITSSHRDSTLAAQMMEEQNVGCILALGGDGTCRAVAKSIDKSPLIALSTGTNNVYPKLIEGTVAGIAAAVIASGDQVLLEEACTRDKRIEIYKNGTYIDLALVDVVITNDIYIGAKAIWNFDDISTIIVTRGHPASIGFSSIVGCAGIVREVDDFGVALDLKKPVQKIIAPVAAGMIREIGISRPKEIKINDAYSFIAEEKGMIALDGEREVSFKSGDHLTFKITRHGPKHVNVQRAIEKGMEQGFFNV
jgi:predicted polyphosphate/ATP-dependent NAD kinase